MSIDKIKERKLEKMQSKLDHLSWYCTTYVIENDIKKAKYYAKLFNVLWKAYHKHLCEMFHLDKK